MMLEKQHTWICSYDIRHAKRLRKLHQYLCMRGIALNYSVFYLSLTPSAYAALCRHIQKIIHVEDDVRLYRCAALTTAVVVEQIALERIHFITEHSMMI